MRRVHGKQIPLVLYHWSLRTRRASILRRGLRIKSRSTSTRLDFNPPYTCFATAPVFALCLCLWRRKNSNTVYDLYECYPRRSVDVVKQRRDYSHEYRIFNNLPKSRVRLIATTSLKPNQHKPWR